MEARFALLADAVNLSREGKLNIAGEFDTIWTPMTPTHWPYCHLVARFWAKVSEGSRHTFQISLTRQDGREVLPKTAEAELQFVPTAPRGPLKGQIIAQLAMVEFPDFGTYEFRIYINRKLAATVPVYVRQTEQTTA